MSGTGDSRPPRRLIDAAAKARFLAALRGGAHRQEAAGAAGFTLEGLYTARGRDPLFRLAWDWAMELSAADERAERLARRADGDAPVRIAPQGQRRLQRRRMRWVRFTEKRQQIFLDHFAGTADAEAAATAAGVCYHTVRAHYRRHTEFAAAWAEALAIAFARLEAEAVRQRLAAQRRLAENLEPAGEMAEEFERVMKLLARYDRKDGRIAAREVSRGRRRSLSFEQAMALLKKRLRNLGIPILKLPPEIAARYDGEDDQGDQGDGDEERPGGEDPGGEGGG
jgi:hypothetical protein